MQIKQRTRRDQDTHDGRHATGDQQSLFRLDDTKDGRLEHIEDRGRCEIEFQGGGAGGVDAIFLKRISIEDPQNHPQNIRVHHDNETLVTSHPPGK